MLRILSIILLVNIVQLYGLGGKKPVNIDTLRTNKDLQDILNMGVRHYNSKINSHYLYTPYRVHHITQQVVAGHLYEFEVTLVGTNCKNEPNDDSKKTLYDCGVNENLAPKRVQLSVLSAPWQNPKYRFNILSDTVENDFKLHDQLFVVGLPDGNSVSGLNFKNFKDKYQKSYENEDEEKYRYKQFHANFKRALLMKFLEKGSAEYGVTQFSDLTENEFADHYLNPSYEISKKPTKISPIPLDYRTPAAIDWRTLGAVTPVKNQGQCGSCWAFSTTGNIEGQWFLKTKKLVSLSEQQLVDCDTIDEGCNGGLPSQAYKAIQQMGGLEKEEDYPYTARQGTCSLNKSKLAVYVNGSVSISTSESDMATWCSLNGPISIGINAFAMQFYRGGISHPFSFFCNPNHLDHGVLIVGYNTTETNEPFWTIKNSWGESWGEKGYYRIFRGSGSCGLNKMPTSAVINV